MREQAAIKNFEQLGEALKEQKEKEIQETFERALKGKFDRVSPGMFDSQIPEIESIIITPVTSENSRSINATVKYLNQDNKPRSVIFSIFDDGLISGRLPNDLKVSRQDLSLEILRAIERINFNFWRQTDLEVLPESDEAERPRAAVEDKELEELKEEEADKPLNRIERLEFLEQQPRVVCGFVNGANGFRGYHGAILADLDNFIRLVVLEHPRFGNAAYLVNTGPIKVDEDIFNKPADQRVDQKTYEEILATAWKPISEKAKSRGELRREFNAQRIIHTPKTWQRKLQEAIDSRLKTKKTT